jgi:lipopolysaccharide transport system permease protein
MMIFYKVPFTWNVLWIIPFLLLTLITALAVGLWLSALNVRYRDVQQMIPFLIQAWMFASPVAYSARIITDRTWQLIYGLNPLAGIIQGFRWSLLGGTPPGELMWISSTVMVLLFISGLYYFRRMEKTFADTV